jgi:hypothetical protein
MLPPLRQCPAAVYPEGCCYSHRRLPAEAYPPLGPDGAQHLHRQAWRAGHPSCIVAEPALANAQTTLGNCFPQTGAWCTLLSQCAARGVLSSNKKRCSSHTAHSTKTLESQLVRPVDLIPWAVVHAHFSPGACRPSHQKNASTWQRINLKISCCADALQTVHLTQPQHPALPNATDTRHASLTPANPCYSALLKLNKRHPHYQKTDEM